MPGRSRVQIAAFATLATGALCPWPVAFTRGDALAQRKSDAGALFIGQSCLEEHGDGRGGRSRPA